MDIKISPIIITEICVGNSSISHNVMAWKPKESGKWEWVYDPDRVFRSFKVPD
jgi:hypothetical protein